MSYITSKSRFAVDRDFGYITLPPEEVVGSSLNPMGLSVDPSGGSEDLMNFCANACSNFYVNSAVEVNFLNVWTKTHVQLSGKFGHGNQTHMNFDNHRPTQKCQIHCFYNSK